MLFSLTLGILFFASDAQEREKASALLQESKESVIRPILDEFHCDGGIEIGIEGLEFMNDDPSEVHVIYAKISKGKMQAHFTGQNTKN